MTPTHPQTDLERAAGDGVQTTTDSARQGIETHHVRWILAISLVLGIAVVGGSWFAFAPHAPPAPPSVVASTAQ